jgi:ribosomal protein S2
MRIPIFQLLDSNLHIGHRFAIAHRLNYYAMYCVRSAYTIFDLEQTVTVLKRVLAFTRTVMDTHGKFLFCSVTPARFVQRYILLFSKRLKQPAYCVTCWEGGFLSNWNKMRSIRIRQMRNIACLKNPASPLERRYNKYQYYLSSLLRKTRSTLKSKPTTELVRSALREDYTKRSSKFMGKIKPHKSLGAKNSVRALFKSYYSFPDIALFFNPANNTYALREFANLKIPLIGIVDSTNENTRTYTFPIFGNSTSISNLRIITQLLGHSILDARFLKRQRLWRALQRNTYYAC